MSTEYVITRIGKKKLPQPKRIEVNRDPITPGSVIRRNWSGSWVEYLCVISVNDDTQPLELVVRELKIQKPISSTKGRKHLIDYGSDNPQTCIWTQDWLEREDYLLYKNALYEVISVRMHKRKKLPVIQIVALPKPQKFQYLKE